MTYTEWIEQVEKIRYQYFEGAITAREYFNAAVGRAIDVEQTEIDEQFPDEILS